MRGFNQFLLGLDSEIDQIRVIDILPMFLKHDSHVLAAPPSFMLECKEEPTVMPDVLSYNAIKRKVFDGDNSNYSLGKRDLRTAH